MEQAAKKTSQRLALGRGLASLISTPPISVIPPQESQRALGAEREQYPHEVSDHVSDHAKLTESKSSPDVVFVDIDRLSAGKFQPRNVFGDAEISELASSIRNLGLLQPILVRTSSSGADNFEIVAGERRWRASKMAGLARVPIIIKDFDDKTALEIALVENIQREDLNPVEVARGFERLSNEFALSHEQIAERVGKDRASVSNLIRILKLPADVLAIIADGSLSLGHAKVLLGIREPNAQSSLARKVLAENLSVRALEEIVARVVVLDSGKRTKAKPHIESQYNQSSRGLDLQDITERLRKALATKVAIKHHKNGRGRLEIEYFSEAEFERIVDLILS